MRLIDAEKLREEYLGMPNCYNGFSDTYDKAMIVDMVDEQPTIDAVPVVRCKDCKYWRDDDCKNDNHGYCPISENDFCSRGVRKETRCD